MKICIVGGIFDKPVSYRTKHVHTPETTLVSGLMQRGVRVEGLGHSTFRPRGRSDDLVHVHHLADGAIRMIGARQPFVFTAHSGPIIHGYQQSVFRRVLFRYVLRNCDAVVSLSRRETAFLEAEIGRATHRPRIAEISNGIDGDLFKPMVHDGLTGDRPVELLYVGQLSPVKGVEHLIQAVKMLLPHYDLRLTLAYQTNAREHAYKKLVAELDLSDRVFFRGFVSHSQLPDLYNAADLLVLPSYAEALPSVISESLMCGTPVVATDVGGIKDQVGQYGVVVEPGSNQEIALGIRQAIDRISDFQSNRNAMSAYAASRFSITKMIDEHIALYQAILYRKRRIPPVTFVLGVLLNLALDGYRWKKN